MKRKFLAGLLSGLMILSLAACGGGSDNGGEAKDSGDTGEKVKIQFMHQMVEQERQEVVDELIQAFQDDNPDIEVEQIPTNEDAYETKITALGQSGELPDVLELGQDFAKTCAQNEFVDYEAVQSVIDEKTEEAFYETALNVVKTEDGENYTGVPYTAWVQGIFYNTEMLESKGLAEPKNWDDILKIAEAFYDKENKKYGIAIPTADTGFTEQVFSQFALSNNANVFDKDGNVTFNTPEMKEALEFYKQLAGYTMPGSNDVPEVNDAFMNGSVPMAIYSTYLIPGAFEAGTIDKINFVAPSNKSQATFGTVSVLSISADLEDARREAAQKFINFMTQDENNIKWLHMSPGGQQPVIKSVAESEEFLSNEIIQSYPQMSDKISEAFNGLQIFGSVEGKNFMAMGEVTRKGTISKAVNDVVVNGADVDATLESAQKEIEETAK